MKWLEFCQQVPPEFVEPVSYLFHRYGRGTAIEEMPGCELVTLRAYLPASSRWRRAHIEVGIRLIGKVGPLPDLQVRETEEGAWEEAWKNHFTLLRVGRRVVIKPSWGEYEPAPGDALIELDPGMAFGTGHHPTTCTCLEALEELAFSGARVLDLGTGSGILGIAALRLGARKLVALDVDPVAVRVARANFRANGFRREVRLARGSLPHRLVEEEGFDIALANINAYIVKEKTPRLAATLRPGGFLVASGILDREADDVKETLEAHHLHVTKTLRQGDWATLLARKAVRPTKTEPG